MMYESKLAVAIKNNGKVLRENGNEVMLPFGSEFSILLKNQNVVRVNAKISIDGQDVTGDGLVINANSSVDLERYINNKNLSKGNKFKFIEKTLDIEKHRGNRVDDGLVRVEFEFENQYIYNNSYWCWNSGPSDYKNNIYGTQDPLQNIPAYPFYGTITCNNVNVATTTQVNAQNSSITRSAGITVPGSESHQSFMTTTFNGDGNKHVLVFKLVGAVEQTLIQKPVTVKTKPKCITCGRQNKATSKFCVNCGTALNIIK